MTWTRSLIRVRLLSFPRVTTSCLSRASVLRCYPRVSSSSMAKVLALHGFSTNATFLQQQLNGSGFTQSLQSVADFYCVDGPISVEKYSQLPEDFTGPFYAWWSAEKGEDGKYSYNGWDRTVEKLQAYVKQNGPFDGVLGFSQGGCVASLLLSLQQRHQWPEDIPSFKFAILISAFPSRGEQHRELYQDIIQCRSLHITGMQEDKQFLAATETLRNMFANPTVMFHPGGHRLPKLQSSADIDTISAFINDSMT